MAFDLASIQSGPRAAPPRIVLYGPHGIGKTTFGASAPNPIFICTEDGLGMLETPAFPVVESMSDVINAANTLLMQEHDFQTLVLDSADWLDNMIQKELKAKYDDKKLGFNRDALLGAEAWMALLEWFNALRTQRQMAIILIAHCEVKRFDPPDAESYERYQPKLQAKASALIQEWADMVLFSNAMAYTNKESINGDKKKQITRPAGQAQRLLHTGEQPAYLAKNRYALPETLPFSWDALMQAMPVPF